MAAAAVLAWLLKRFRVEGWVAVVVAAAVALMHPQVLRWSGHYALAYSVVLPGVWALCIRWADRPGWGRAAAVGGAITAALFTHAYLGAMSAAFAGVFLVGMWAVYRPTSLRAAAGATFVATALPLLLFRGFIALTDGHGLRTDNPYGFWDNVSTWDALWLPSHGPLGSLRQALGTGLNAWDGGGHVGTGAVVALVVDRTPGSDVVEVSLRLNSPDVAPVLATFSRFGYSIRTLFHAPGLEEQMRERYEAFMRYLGT